MLFGQRARLDPVRDSRDGPKEKINPQGFRILGPEAGNLQRAGSQFGTALEKPGEMKDTFTRLPCEG